MTLRALIPELVAAGHLDRDEIECWVAGRLYIVTHRRQLLCIVTNLEMIGGGMEIRVAGTGERASDRTARPPAPRRGPVIRRRVSIRREQLARYAVAEGLYPPGEEPMATTGKDWVCEVRCEMTGGTSKKPRWSWLRSRPMSWTEAKAEQVRHERMERRARIVCVLDERTTLQAALTTAMEATA